MPSKSDLLDIVAEIYDAAADHRLWNAVLEKIVALHKAGSAVLEVRQVQTDQTAIAAVSNVDVAVTGRYEHEYGTQNILLKRGARLLTEGAVVTDDMLCPSAEFLSSAYYNEYLREVDVRSLLGGVVLANPSARAILSVMRPHDMPRFTDAECDTLTLLMPHLQRALRFHFQLSQLRTERDDIAGTLDKLALGVVFVESNGKVSFVNAAAARIFRTEDGLSLRAGELLIRDRAAAQMYRTQREAAARNATAASADCAASVVVVSRPSGRRSYSLSVYPSRSGALVRPWATRPGVVLFISDPDAQHAPPLEVFAQVHGLTRAELRVVGALTQSGSLREAAEKLGVTRNTVHSQLNAVYQKTGVRNQAALSRLIYVSTAQALNGE